MHTRRLVLPLLPPDESCCKPLSTRAELGAHIPHLPTGTWPGFDKQRDYPQAASAPVVLSHMSLTTRQTKETKIQVEGHLQDGDHHRPRLAKVHHLHGLRLPKLHMHALELHFERRNPQ